METKAFKKKEARYLTSFSLLLALTSFSLLLAFLGPLESSAVQSVRNDATVPS